MPRILTLRRHKGKKNCELDTSLDIVTEQDLKIQQKLLRKKTGKFITKRLFKIV